jgi:hypothetical protein
VSSPPVIPLPTRPPPPLEVVGGICEKEAIDLLRAFYRAPNPKAPKNQVKAPKVEKHAKTDEDIRLLNTALSNSAAAEGGSVEQVEPVEQKIQPEEKKIKL